MSSHGLCSHNCCWCNDRGIVGNDGELCPRCADVSRAQAKYLALHDEGGSCAWCNCRRPENCICTEGCITGREALRSLKKVQEASVDDHGAPIPAVMAKVIDNYAPDQVGWLEPRTEDEHLDSLFEDPVDVDKYLPKEAFRTEFGWALDCEKIGCTVKDHAGWVFPYSTHAVRPDDHPTKLVTRKVIYSPWT